MTKVLIALLGCACIAAVSATAAEPEHAPPPGHMMQGPGHGPRTMLPPGVHLDEAQQDKVFAIVHAQQPQMREHEKAARHAHEALRAMAASGQFDDARASALAQASARAMAAMTLQRARMDAQITALLTPEQRRQAREPGQHHGSRPDPRPDPRPEPR